MRKKKQLKGMTYSIYEDYQPNTRFARKQLLEFGRAQRKPQKLRRDNLIIENTTYAFDRTTQKVVPRSSQLSTNVFVNSSHNSLSFLCSNVISILAKRDSLRNLIDTTELNFVVLTKTWLNPSICDSEILSSFPGFDIVRRDRVKKSNKNTVWCSSCSPPQPAMFSHQVSLSYRNLIHLLYCFLSTRYHWYLLSPPRFRRFPYC